MITNLEAGTTMDLDARKWPDAQADDDSAFYKVILRSKTIVLKEDTSSMLNLNNLHDFMIFYVLSSWLSSCLRFSVMCINDLNLENLNTSSFSCSFIVDSCIDFLRC